MIKKNEEIMTDILGVFDEEAKLFDRLVIDNISYFDRQQDKLQPVRLELLGHSVLISNKSTNQTVKTLFGEKQNMMCSASHNPKMNNYTVTLMFDTDLMFIMSEQKKTLIEEYYAKVNEYYAELNLKNLVSYVQKTNEVLGELFEHIDDLLDMTIHFIEEQPVGFFTSFENVMMLECYVQAIDPEKYSRVLLSSEEARQRFVGNNQALIKSKEDIVSSFFDNDFRYFQKLLDEKSHDVDVLIAYLFLFNVILQRYAFKWQEEHGDVFADVENVDLDTMIVHFCALEDVDLYDVDTKGAFFYYLQQRQKFEGDSKMLDNMVTYHQLLKHHLDELKFNSFKSRLKKEPQARKYSIDDVDLMNGQEFEDFIALIFSRMGYQTEVTKASGDQGIDVIAMKDDKKIGIQAKCYSSTVGNSAVQEVVAGKAFYKLDKVIVATNNFFTDSALQLAQANGVVLWDRNMLKEKIKEVVN